MKNLNYLTDLILWQIFKIIFSISSRIMKHCLINHQSKYISTKFNRIIFKIKTRNYLEIYLRLLGSTKINITKDRNSDNVPQLELTEVILVHCNIFNNQYQHYSKVLYTFVANGSFGQLLSISPANNIYSETFHSEFSFIKVWFADQKTVLLNIEDIIN